MVKSLDIPKICNGKLIQEGKDVPIHRLLLDSRKMVRADDSLFIAVSGDRHDGHAYVRELYGRGVRNFIVERIQEVEQLPGATIVQVKNSIHALQQLAAWHRAQFHLPVIGITGSNGKTIVKEWLNQMLAEDFVIVRSPKSFNSQVGVPLSVWNIEPVHGLGIFEAGISLPGEMARLEEVIQPGIGIITNIGQAHLENFSDQEELAREKVKLFARCNKIIYCSDHRYIAEALDREGVDQKRRYSWRYASKDSARKGDSDFFIITDQQSTPHGTELTAVCKDRAVQFSFAFSDNASVQNCIACIVTLLALGSPPDAVQARLERLTPLHMRLELLDGINQCTIVNDAYSSDLHSLEIALDFMHANAHQKNKIVILSDIVQSGIPREQLYARVNAMLVEKNIQKLVGIGKEITSSEKLFDIPAEFFPSVQSFLQQTQHDAFAASAILVKGAREFRCEQITDWLQENTHETVLEVDLGALAHNLNYFKSLLHPETRIMVMVKAFGYGSGAQEVASLLEFNKVDYLAVAYTDEGVALRRAGVSLPIMVMNPELNSLPSLIRHKLEPEIYSFTTLDRFSRALEVAGWPGSYPVHIKVDTGMHRLGLDPSDINALLDRLEGNKSMHVASVFTHMASSENPEHDEFSRMQLESFENCCRAMSDRLKKPFLRHALNTGGIQRFPNAQYDMVRLGIGLYGVAAFGDDQQELQMVSSLRTVISQLKKVKKGESVGYGRSFIAPRDVRIATIPLGYADGLRRALGNGRGYVLIHGKKAPIAGNVCMDMTMIDVTDVPCNEGDPVIVFGKGLPLVEFSRLSETIPYEILTSIPQRVKRLYIQE